MICKWTNIRTDRQIAMLTDTKKLKQFQDDRLKVPEAKKFRD